MNYLNKIFEIIIVPTLDCNFKCKYCHIYNNLMDSETKSWKLDIDLLFKFFNYNRNSLECLKTVGFFGGEPLLEFDKVKKIINYFHNFDNKITFFLDTNGSLLDNSVLKFLSKYKVFIKISIDGDEKTHNFNRMDYRKIIKNLMSFISFNNIVASMVVTPNSAKDLSFNINHLYKLGICNFEIYPQFNIRWDHYEIKIFNHNLNSIINNFSKEIKQKKIVFARGSHFSRKNRNEIFSNCRCGTLKKRFLILPNNFIYSCIGMLALKKKYWRFFQIGNLNTTIKYNYNFDKFFILKNKNVQNFDKYLPPCSFFETWQDDSDNNIKRETFRNLVKVMASFYNQLLVLCGDINFFDMR